MKKILTLFMLLVISACSTKYILMDENGNPVQREEWIEGNSGDLTGELPEMVSESSITANDVFVVSEGGNFVTYQYKNVRVDEISPLASMYCADVAYGRSPYLREVSMYHNGFMRATFDCVNLAI